MAHHNPELRRHMAWLDRNGLYVWGVFYKFKIWSTIYISNDCCEWDMGLVMTKPVYIWLAFAGEEVKTVA